MRLATVLRRSFVAQILGLSAMAAYWQARGVTELAGSLLAVREFDGPSLDPGLDTESERATSARSSNGEAGREAGDHATSAFWILARNPFDSTSPRPLGGSPAVVEGRDELGAVCNGVRAVIVVAASDPDGSVAALMIAAPHPRFVRVGDDVGGGRKVQLIDWNRVVLSVGAKSCETRMFQQPNAPNATADASRLASADARAPVVEAGALPPEIASKIRKVGKNEFHVGREVLDHILQNQMELMKLVRIVPEQENGKAVGVRLFGIRPSSLLGVLGLENGDTLRSINGFELSSPENALQAYARLRTAEHLVLETSRGGKTQSIDFDIK